MRRTLLALLTVAALVVIALPGAAKPPDGKGKPTADEPPMGGTVCGTAEMPDDFVWIDSDTFRFTLGGKTDGTCIDVTWPTAGPWLVTIEGNGANYLGIIPRDSIGPGDSCGGYLLRSGIYDHGEGSPLVLGYGGVVPAATVNACGTEFAEWVDPVAYGLPDAYGCAATDDAGNCLVTEALPDVEHPLAFQVFLRGRDGTSTTFTVDLP